ncbi:MAG: MarR family transcriptional regulator [Erysipelothrix sp.]|jgi:predicted transcriptional regulator|nr:MarR family transcriptional regulator [Erysipelothrix sp.]
MIKSLVSYLKENLDDEVLVKKWEDKNKLPLLLQSSYNYYETRILNHQIILIEIMENSPNVEQLQKHLMQIRNQTEYPLVLLFNEISRYRRKSLIKNRISFLIKDGQMYMPFLGLDLNKVSEFIEREAKPFTTPAQIAYLFFLYNYDSIVNVTDFAKKMNFNTMTASRALNDLYNANLITYELSGMTGRSKEYKRISNPEYLNKGKDYLKSPVWKIVHAVKEPKGAYLAGLDALSNLSMLNPQKKSVYAISKDNFYKGNIEIVKNKDLISDMNLVELEIWNYDPKLFTKSIHVDLMSLYLSLRDLKDERVEQALDEVLQGESWYME